MHWSKIVCKENEITEVDEESIDFPTKITKFSLSLLPFNINYQTDRYCPTIEVLIGILNKYYLK